MDHQYAIRMQYEADALQWLYERSTKVQAQGGRVLAQNIVAEDNNHPLLLSKTQSHGHMAPSFRRKYLVCFYCNNKSNIRYDGLITRWDCTQCESTNFLDEVQFLTPCIRYKIINLMRLLIPASRMGILQILQSQPKPPHPTL
jgi:hypothetical protein